MLLSKSYIDEILNFIEYLGPEKLLNHYCCAHTLSQKSVIVLRVKSIAKYSNVLILWRYYITTAT